MWYDLINNAIILLASLSLGFFLFKKKYNVACALSIVFYCCLPVAKWGSYSMNSAYFITAVLGVFYIIAFKRKEIRPLLWQRIYLGLMSAGIVFMAIGWIAFGRATFSGLASFAGALQYMLGAFFLSSVMSLCKKSGLSLRRAMYSAFTSITVLNGAFALFQLAFYKPALFATYQLFVSPIRKGPIISAISTGRFVRAFGCTYTPIFLGVISLCVCAFILGDVIVCPKRNVRRALLFAASSIVGLMALSKTIILGIIIQLVLFVLLLVFSSLKEKKIRINLNKIISVSLTYILITVIAFSAVYAFGVAAGNGEYVNHYYSSLLDPARALDSRYSGIFADNDADREKSEDENEMHGITLDAFEVFSEHPVVGVGPQAVKGEFLGDSQFIIVLHDGGILMFLCYTLYYAALFFACLSGKENLKIIPVLAALGACCLSIPALYSACTIPFSALIIPDDEKLQLNPFTRKSEENGAPEIAENAHIEDTKSPLRDSQAPFEETVKDKHHEPPTGAFDETLIEPTDRQSGKLRIVQVIPAPGTGGAEVFLSQLCRNIDKNRFEIHLVFLYGNGDIDDNDNDDIDNTDNINDSGNRDGIGSKTGSACSFDGFDEAKSSELSLFKNAGIKKIYRMGKKRGLDLGLIIRLRRLYGKIRPDIIHTHLYACVYSRFAARKLRFENARQFHTVHNMARQELPFFHRSVMRRAYKKGGITPIAISKAVAKSVECEYKINNFPIVFNGIDRSAVIKKVTSEETNITESEIKFICAARFFPQKNHRLLISAFAGLLKEHPHLNASLTLAGDGPAKAEALLLCKELGISKNVIFPGVISDLPKRLCEYDAFVLSSDYEGLPISVIEAMSAALPVITTNAGGVGELVKNNVNGIVVPVGDLQALKNAMAEISQSQKMRSDMGKASYLISEGFDIGACAKEYEGIFEKALGDD